MSDANITNSAKPELQNATEQKKFDMAFCCVGGLAERILSLNQEEGVVALRWYKAWCAILSELFNFSPVTKGYSHLRNPVKFSCEAGSIVLGIDTCDPCCAMHHMSSWTEADENEWVVEIQGISHNRDALFECVARAVEKKLNIKIVWRNMQNNDMQMLMLVPAK